MQTDHERQVAQLNNSGNYFDATIHVANQILIYGGNVVDVTSAGQDGAPFPLSPCLLAHRCDVSKGTPTETMDIDPRKLVVGVLH